MSHNTFGHLFRVTTWGESHGPALGCVVDGCPPGIRFTFAELQHWMDKRKPGQSSFVTQRREDDIVKVLSGVMPDPDGETLITTGTPVSMMIENTDQRSKDYGEIARQYRPGHADFTYDTKYGIRDYRGGGRSSARETAARVAAGGLARKVIPGVTIRGALVQIGTHKINRKNWNWDEVNNNPFFAPDPEIVPVWEEYLEFHLARPEAERQKIMHQSHNAYLAPDERRFVTPEVIKRFCIVGEPAEVLEQVRELERKGVRQLMCNFPLERGYGMVREYAKNIIQKL